MIRSEAVDRLSGFEERLRALGAISPFVFGSTARGEANEAFDLGLFADADPSARFGISDVVRAKYLVEDEMQFPVDLRTRAGLRPAARDRIEREAIRIF